MNTVTINRDAYQSAEAYARQHNISIEEVVEKGISLLMEKIKIRSRSARNRSSEFEHAMAFMDTIMMKKGGTPIPSDEDGKGIVARMKYDA